MTKRIFRSIVLVAMVVFLVSLSVSLTALYNYFSQGQIRQLQTEVRLISLGAENRGVPYLEAVSDLGCRITWVDSDGTVRFDSTNSNLENHLQREEVQQALETGYGQSSRYSVTEMYKAVYVAQRLSDGSVIRLSMASLTVPGLLLQIGQPLLAVVVLMVLLCLWLAYRLSRFVVQPLNNLNLNDPLSNVRYEELRPLLGRIDSQQRQMTAHRNELMRKQREFDTVTNNMSEGLVLMNENCTVLTMNPAAARIMGLVRPYVGISFHTLTHAEMLREMLGKALNGRHAEQILTLPLGQYQAAASPVRSGDKVSGVVLLLFDVTEKFRAELQRREFTANVSHELKTPLHAISGYAELLKSGLVQPEDVGHFSEKIYGEAQRMTRLVEDILKLSRLDEGAGVMPREPVELYALAQDVVRSLEESTRKAQVAISLTGSPVTLVGVPQLLSGIVMNLCTNAIKYNRPGGRVEVTVAREGDSAVLTVLDTGIGIPAEHQDRIFERFYRVDKSHSKSVGGTGLGLSIVKHAVLIHGGSIDLESRENVGTTIRVHLRVGSADTQC